jgi:phytoene desaturase
MVNVAQRLGVNIVTERSVTSFLMDSRSPTISSVVAGDVEYRADVVVGSGDYHHIETQLLESQWRGYSDKYWESRVMAPSCLLFYLGLNITIPHLKHHTLFFDEDFGPHAASIYETHTWPDKPLLYVCSPSKSDPSVAPEGNENLFVLIPVAAGLSDTDVERIRYREYALRKISQLAGINVANHILVERYFGVNDFKSEYSSLKGNAYGLANTLFQTAFLKPRMRSKKVKNLFYAGQLTVPGPGVPPSLISGKVVAELIRGGG